MDVTKSELAATYKEKSDAELFDLYELGTLTDLANEALLEELNNRGHASVRGVRDGPNPNNLQNHESSVAPEVKTQRFQPPPTRQWVLGTLGVALTPGIVAALFFLGIGGFFEGDILLNIRSLTASEAMSLLLMTPAVHGLMGFGVVVWYGSFRGYKRLNRWLWLAFSAVVYLLLWLATLLFLLFLINGSLDFEHYNERYRSIRLAKEMAPYVWLFSTLNATILSMKLYSPICRLLRRHRLRKSGHTVHNEGNSMVDRQIRDEDILIGTIEQAGNKVTVKPAAWIVKEPFNIQKKIKSFQILSEYAGATREKARAQENSQRED